MTRRLSLEEDLPQKQRRILYDSWIKQFSQSKELS